DVLFKVDVFPFHRSQKSFKSVFLDTSPDFLEVEGGMHPNISFDLSSNTNDTMTCDAPSAVVDVPVSIPAIPTTSAHTPNSVTSTFTLEVVSDQMLAPI
ncbi:hypothetical protein HAX54_006241, partial [Datura stramonium]|nr:hypothetical protein [Datura stramonium]